MYDNNMKTNDLKLVKPQEEFLRQVLFMKDDDKVLAVFPFYHEISDSEYENVVENFFDDMENVPPKNEFCLMTESEFGWGWIHNRMIAHLEIAELDEYEDFKNNMANWEKNVSEGKIDEQSFNDTRETLNSIGEIMDLGAEQAIVTIDYMKKINTIIELSMFSLIIIISSISGLSISRYINKSINKINSTIAECEVGNINARIGITNKDEIGNISQNFDSFISKVYLIMKDFQELSNQVVNQMIF